MTSGAAVAIGFTMQLRNLVVPFLIAASACGTEAPRAASPAGQAAAPAGHAAAQAPTPPPAASTSAATAPAATVTPVADPSLVCMVNNQLMAKPQIPVEVNGLTYYGCCAMCKERLANDAASREAKDPVTGETVDKAKAVMASDANGAILYFASVETLKRYSVQ